MSPSRSLHRLALGAVALSLAAAGGGDLAQAQTRAMPFLLAARDLDINAATTFNGSYGAGFEATGSLSGTAGFSPANNPQSTNNTGLAFLSAMVSFDGGSAGVLAGVSGLTSMVVTAGTPTFILRNSSEIFADGTGSGNPPVGTPNVRPTLVVSGLTITGSGSSSTVAASLVGTNTGTEVLQVSGRIGEQVLNELNNGSSRSALEIQLSAF